MDLADLQRLVDAFEASDWKEIHLEVDGVEVHLSAVSGNGGQSDPFPARPPAAAATPPAAAAPAPAGGGAPEGVTGTPFATPGSGIGAAPTAPTEGAPVLAPSPGIFWRSPAPGQPPFVEVGTLVEPDTVVCIVELMKLMNRVSAGVAGVVTAIPVGNGVPVEKGEPIVYVAPDPT
jgi:acetyl-CoA carboxylase biotin carboxyl carrier protein